MVGFLPNIYHKPYFSFWKTDPSVEVVLLKPLSQIPLNGISYIGSPIQTLLTQTPRQSSPFRPSKNQKKSDSLSQKPKKKEALKRPPSYFSFSNYKIKAHLSVASELVSTIILNPSNLSL